MRPRNAAKYTNRVGHTNSAFAYHLQIHIAHLLWSAFSDRKPLVQCLLTKFDRKTNFHTVKSGLGASVIMMSNK